MKASAPYNPLMPLADVKLGQYIEFYGRRCRVVAIDVHGALEGEVSPLWDVKPGDQIATLVLRPDRDAKR